ncbi:MAG: hypothetical protein J1E97_03665 [Muribaculaceae bacterium]|nr:hypothetical protein [Muribaculaceae bacterium]
MKLQPKEKVYEAWTAIEDNRVSLHADYATVKSSDDSKEYIVRFDGDVYASDDNATYWRGYPGYPVVAVLMLQGRLPFDAEVAHLWKDVNWKEINTRFKNRYAEAVAFVAKERSIDMVLSEKAADEVMAALEKLPLTIKRKI